MLCPPLLDTLHIIGASEVIAVFGPAQPTTLIGLLTEGLAFRARTILLPSAMAVIGDKQLLAMQAFAADGFGLHRVKTLPDKSSAAGPQAGRKSTGEEAGKRREQEI